jgi:two-component system invasion response regulator UvrY
MIRIVIADDHELIREGIKNIIRRCADLRVVGEAADIAHAIELVAKHQPEVVVLDTCLPGYDGLEGLAELRRHFPKQRIVMLSMYREERFAARALRAGASAYISKGTAAGELVRALREVMAGGAYIGPGLAGLLARQARAAALHGSLTGREAQVLALIGSGQQIKQIAAELELSVSSVNTYRNRIFRKMDLTSNAALIRYAIEHGLVN